MKNPSETCADVLSSLPLFVGGELETDAARTVESHLARCGACRAAHERASRARAALGTLRAELAPAPDLWPGLRGTLVDEGLLAGSAQGAHARPARGREPSKAAATSGSLSSAPSSRPLLRRLVPAAAAAALLALLGLELRDGVGSPRPSPATPPFAERRLELEAPRAVAPVRGSPLEVQLASDARLAGGLRRVGADEPRLIEAAGAQPVTVPVFVVPGMGHVPPAYDRPASLQPAGNFR